MTIQRHCMAPIHATVSPTALSLPFLRLCSPEGRYGRARTQKHRVHRLGESEIPTVPLSVMRNEFHGVVVGLCGKMLVALNFQAADSKVRKEGAPVQSENGC
jgi:hypothetical protein